MSRAVLLVLVVAFGLALSPGSALAVECVAAPGTAAVDQYCEVVPEVDRDRDSTNRAPGQPQSPQTIDQIAAGGPDGRRLADTLQRVRKARRTSDARAAAPADDGPVSAALGATGAGGISGWLIAAMVLAGIVVAALAVWRRRASA